MRQAQDRLSAIEVMLLIPSAIISVTVLTLPRIAINAAPFDAVFATFITGIVCLLITIVMVLLSRKYKNDSIIDYSEKIIGKIPAIILSILFSAYGILVSGVILRVFSDVLKIILLDKTPLEVIMISMLIVVVYLIQNGISSLAKSCEIFLPFTIIALVLVLVLSYRDFNIEEFFPGFSKGILPSLSAIPNLIPAFLGFEIVLFVVPFMQKPEKVLSYSIIGMSITIVLLTALVAMAIGTMGRQSVANHVYPTLIMAENITFPGGFAERFEVFFIVLWILGAFISMSIFYYIASFSVTHLLKLKNFKPFVFILLPIIYLIAILPQDLYQIEKYTEVAGYFGGILILFVVLIFIISLVRKERKTKK